MKIYKELADISSLSKDYRLIAYFNRRFNNLIENKKSEFEIYSFVENFKHYLENINLNLTINFDKYVKKDDKNIEIFQPLEMFESLVLQYPNTIKYKNKLEELIRRN